MVTELKSFFTANVCTLCNYHSNMGCNTQPPPPSKPGGRYYLFSALVDPMKSWKDLQQCNFNMLYIYTVAPRLPNFSPSAWTSKCVYHPCLMWLRLSAQVRMMGRCGAQRPPLRVLSGTFLWCGCVNDWLSCEDWYQVLPNWNLPSPLQQPGHKFEWWNVWFLAL